MAKPFESLDGVSAGASLVMVAQKPSGTANDNTQITARADIEVELPVGTIGAFAPSNAMAFGNTPQPVLMQAWYQMDIPVGAVGGDLGRVEVTLGKIDPFGVFDGNNIADDESETFLNLAFIHNPLLDAGGDITPGDHGASPGLRMAYIGDVNGGNNFSASLGVFAAGGGSNYADSFEDPLVIGQVEYAGKTFAGLAGAYRLYAWNNGSAFDLAGNYQRHSGLGFSIDQEVADHVTLFTRVGLSNEGEVGFDRAYTLGAKFGGGAWGREGDRIGLAAGLLKSCDEYRLASGFTGDERMVELYYTWQVNDNLALTPDFQWIANPAGDTGAKDVTVLGLRAKSAF